VIEMNDGKHDSEFFPQLQQQPQQSDRIRTGRHRDPDSVACLQKLVAPNVTENALRQCLHSFNGTSEAGGTMVLGSPEKKN